MKEYKNILVIDMMLLGDLMLVTPVLRTLRANYPKAHIALMADKKLADIVQYNKNIDECIFMDKKGKDKKISALIRFIKEIRKRKFDLVINLHRNERSSAMAAFSGAEKIVGYSKPGFSLFFDDVMPNLKAVKHQVHSHFDVLSKALGIEKFDDGGLEMWLTPEAEIKAEQLWKENFPANKKVIAFNIGASWLTKRWLDNYFAQCADQLIDEGYEIAFFGGPMDLEIVEKCISQMKHKDSDSYTIFTGKTTLLELAALLKKCVLFLTTDSGPMHIGVSQNVPIVTMFGASPVPGFYPYDSKDILIKTPELCHPCGIHKCPHKGEKNLACMKNITVDVVMKYVHELLDKYGDMAGNIPKPNGNYICRVVEV